MRGLLKEKSPGTQLVLAISIALVSFFIIGLIGTMVLAKISGMNLMEMKDPDKWDINDPKVISVIRGMQVIQFFSLFVIPTWICSRLFSNNSKEYLGLKKPLYPPYFFIGILAMVLALPMVTWLGELNRNIRFPGELENWFRAKEESAARMIQALLQLQSVKDLVLNIICIAGLAAIGEELLFRGLLQRLFIKIFKNHWVGIIVAATLFSAMHLQFYGFFPRLALGILLGVIYWYSGSLWVVILAHFMYDAALIILAYFNPQMIKDETSVELTNLTLLATVSFVLVILLVSWMKKKSPVTFETVYADDPPVKDHPF